MNLQKSNPESWPVWKPEDEAVIKHLRAEGMDDDTLIGAYLASAQADIEAELNFPIAACKLTGWQCDFSVISFFQIPTYRGGVVVKYYDAAGTEQTLSETNYSVLADGIKVRIVFKGTLPALSDREDAVSITMDAGYTTAELVDPIVKQAILIRAAGFYGSREDGAQRYVTASSNMISKIRHRVA